MMALWFANAEQIKKPGESLPSLSSNAVDGISQLHNKTLKFSKLGLGRWWG